MNSQENNSQPAFRPLLNPFGVVAGHITLYPYSLHYRTDHRRKTKVLRIQRRDRLACC